MQPSHNIQPAGPSPDTDHKQAWWKVADNAFILPEYLVQLSCSASIGEHVSDASVAQIVLLCRVIWCSL